MENTAILCHINKPVIQTWSYYLKKEGIFSDLNNPEKILTTFAETLNRLNLPVFFSFEVVNEVTEILTEAVKKNTGTLEYSHELKLLKNIFKENSYQSVLYMDSFFPLLDAVLTEKLSFINEEYLADYSFIENTPAGLSGVFFNRSLFDSMEFEKNENTEEVEIDTSIPDSMDVPLKEYIEKNINQFHVEIHFEHPDLRLLRLDLSCKTPRSILLAHKLAEKINDHENPYASIENITSEIPEILHIFPSYIELELNGSCEYNCTFCPRTFGDRLDQSNLSIDDIRLIIDYSSEGPGDTVFALGGLGEPLEHPEILEILKAMLDNAYSPGLILETNGKYLNKILPVFEHPQAEKLRIIVNINSLNNYESIHGTTTENKEKVKENLESLSKLLGDKNKELKKNIYVQTLKIIENEGELDEIFNYTDTLGISFLLQKYNSYAGAMPEKRVSDMTPLERSFCWHLRRDLYVRANGNVAFCKQDVKGSVSRGNIRSTPLKDIWENSRPDWTNNYRNKFPQKPDCQNCDEYYTFNM